MKEKNQKSFLFDINKCTGCGACVIACETEQSIAEEKSRLRRAGGRILKKLPPCTPRKNFCLAALRQVFTFNESRHPALPHFHLSLACNHCAEPVCLKNCPARAYSKDEKTGAVSIDPKKCMGCKYCTWACPYDAPKFNPERGITEKCDFCLDRINEGKKPACVVACPTGALQFEEKSVSPPAAPPRGEGAQKNIEYRTPNIESRRKEGDSFVIQKPLIGSPRRGVAGFTEAGIEPAINFIPLRRKQQPECTAPSHSGSVEKLFFSSIDIPKSKITLKKEWTLLLFTTIAYILVAFFTASVTGANGIEPFLFLGLGAAAMGLTFVHLGQKSRAWRAIFNWRTSWLSREILFFSLFMGLAGLYLLFFPRIPVLGWATAVIGFISLYSIDKIYQVAMQVGALNFHSAHVLFNGFFLYSVLTGNSMLFVFFGLLKFCLYLYRKRPGNHVSNRLSISLLRIFFGFLLPVGLFFATVENIFSGDIYLLTAASVILGELIDRAEYYDELDVITPPKQMLMDLLTMLKRDSPTCAPYARGGDEPLRGKRQRVSAFDFK
ncbi:MAG: dimethyl sulfoxide reductase anchor subunit [Candidatus Aminicenantes bacterium]|nr:dimethyl sulfoxide reductase anchor subunit [Candidatus Aminicenantes bacterium]